MKGLCHQVGNLLALGRQRQPVAPIISGVLLPMDKIEARLPTPMHGPEPIKAAADRGNRHTCDTGEHPLATIGVISNEQECNQKLDGVIAPSGDPEQLQGCEKAAEWAKHDGDQLGGITSVTDQASGSAGSGHILKTPWTVRL